MNRIEQIAQEISVIGPILSRKIVFDFFQSTEISPTQLHTILIIYESGPSHFSVICEHLNIAAPTATGIIDRLEKGGYVKRVHDTKDRRAINVTLTNKGMKVAKSLKNTIVKRWIEMLSKLSLSDAENLLASLNKVRSVI